MHKRSRSLAHEDQSEHHALANCVEEYRDGIGVYEVKRISSLSHSVIIVLALLVTSHPSVPWFPFPKAVPMNTTWTAASATDAEKISMRLTSKSRIR